MQPTKILVLFPNILDWHGIVYYMEFHEKSCMENELFVWHNRIT